MKIFVDESAWIRLLDPTAAYHKQFVEEFESAIDKGDRLVTHNIAVGTALSEVKNRMGMELAGKFNEVIEEAYTGAHLNILWIGRRADR